MPDRHHEDATTQATAHLPGLEIEILHRRLPDGEGEQIAINLHAAPSFEAFSRFLEPWAFWAQAMQMVWLPWFGAARTLMLPWSMGAPIPKAVPEIPAAPADEPKREGR